MILVDSRERPGKREKMEFVHLFRNVLKVPCDKTLLTYGDFAFEGNGPNGTCMVGVERKTLHDLVSNIDTKNYSVNQRQGMKRMYQFSFLVVEGVWRPHSNEDALMEGFVDAEGRQKWGFFKHLKAFGASSQRYSKVRRYLFSASLSGVHVLYTRDMAHTATDVWNLQQYFAKRWDQHTAMLDMEHVVLPSLSGRVSLTRKWAFAIEGLGLKGSEAAEKHFPNPFQMAAADEGDWEKVPGIGKKRAKDIVAQIMGWRRS